MTSTEHLTSLRDTLITNLGPLGAAADMQLDSQANNMASLTIKPKRVTDKCAEVVITADQSDKLYILIGQCNVFDVSDSFSDETVKYLLSIVAACIEGTLKEDVTYVSEKPIKSKLTLNLNGKITTFNYRDGIFKFGKRKVATFNYEPYRQI